MKQLEDINDTCTWKVIAEKEDSIKFTDIRSGHRLYDCLQCSGTPRSCPNYTSHKALVDKYGGER